MVHQAGAYPSFLSMKRPEVFLLELGYGINVGYSIVGSSAGLPPGLNLSGPIYSAWVKRDTMKVKRFAQEHNTMIQPGLEPRLFDPESTNY